MTFILYYQKIACKNPSATGSKNSKNFSYIHKKPSKINIISLIFPLYTKIFEYAYKVY